MSLFGTYVFNSQVSNKEKGLFDDFLSKQPSPYHESFAHRKRSVAISHSKPPDLTAVELEQGNSASPSKHSTGFFRTARPATTRILVVLALLFALSLVLLLFSVYRVTSKREVVDSSTDTMS